MVKNACGEQHSRAFEVKQKFWFQHDDAFKADPFLDLISRLKRVKKYLARLMSEIKHTQGCVATNFLSRLGWTLTLSKQRTKNFWRCQQKRQQRCRESAGPGRGSILESSPAPRAGQNLAVGHTRKADTNMCGTTAPARRTLRARRCRRPPARHSNTSCGIVCWWANYPNRPFQEASYGDRNRSGEKG
jgi:hypothetical protein